MKNVIVQIIIMVFTVIFVLFGVYYLYYGKIGSGNGFFKGIGSVVSGTTEETIISNGINALENAINVPDPVIRYSGETQHVGDIVNFKELFEISLDGTSFISATMENGFAFYFYDVTTPGGISVVEKLTTADIDNLEEIPAAVLYDTQLHTLHFYKSGTFKIMVRVYIDSGQQYLFECTMPVEVR